MTGESERDPNAPETLPTDVSFDLGSHELRRAILGALAEAQRAAPDDPHLSFAELTRAVEPPDSGNFNYHLGRLVGWFVEREDDGYRLTVPGIRCVAADRSGSLTLGESMEPTSIDGCCPVCGDTLTVEYRAGLLRVACPREDWQLRKLAPATVVDERTPDELAMLVSLGRQQGTEQMLAGVCPICTARVSPTAASVAGGAAITAGCDQCGVTFEATPAACALRHPAVIAFYQEAGENALELPYWALDVEPSLEGSVIGTDPLRIVVSFHAGAASLRVTLDEDARVIRVERVEAT